MKRDDKAAKRAAISPSLNQVGKVEGVDSPSIMSMKDFTLTENKENEVVTSGHGLFCKLDRKFYDFKDDIKDAPEINIPKFPGMHFKIIDMQRTIMRKDTDAASRWETVEYKYITDVIGVTYAFTRACKTLHWFTT